MNSIDGFQAVIPQILPGIGVYWYQGPRYLDYTYWYSYYYLLYLLYPRSPAGPPPQESSSLTQGVSTSRGGLYIGSSTVGYLEYGQLWLKPTTNYPLLDTYHYQYLYPTGKYSIYSGDVHLRYHIEVEWPYKGNQYIYYRWNTIEQLVRGSIHTKEYRGSRYQQYRGNIGYYQSSVRQVCIRVFSVQASRAVSPPILLVLYL